ncbi:MAG: NAD(P)/FAD-dependent oxidoreductase [Hymenobacteraceae bacterium]|nr:NAD(P)/FAD-dependent oxidoreductase [Hymenobacteraceae bacterium]MDX5395502.1 NAD(P)/FAD-dependent oxidoreductase [Hymenobacteraceae bacterium]MDX5444263.1 NAD(P)/FAD-dependent oxidoreductase [Hymenobacteraceae bacterium]MDX5511557.1 NAD(P)/FAD-dependent oxidoreductase [Hymenobacteraceae bacterium]
MLYDVIIVGGGPAGLSAAMLLGRCRRKVLLFDRGKQRNRWSDAMNGFITRDGIAPKEFLNITRNELTKYDITLLDKKVEDIGHDKNNFKVTDKEGNVYESRKLLLATGLRDKLPKIEGIEEFYGKSIHHCPYCDGWESQDKKLAAYGKNRDGIGLALSLKTWSPDVVLLTDGTNRLSKKDMAKLQLHNITVCTNAITRLEGEGGKLHRIIFSNSEVMERDAIFFSTGTEQQSHLPRQLGCEFTSKGVIRTKGLQHTNQKGLYVAGDAARDVQLVIVAAAEGTRAGVAINMELQEEDRELYEQQVKAEQD